jgi:hypothetical protein
MRGGEEKDRGMSKGARGERERERREKNETNNIYTTEL